MNDHSESGGGLSFCPMLGMSMGQQLTCNSNQKSVKRQWKGLVQRRSLSTTV